MSTVTDLLGELDHYFNSLQEDLDEFVIQPPPDSERMILVGGALGEKLQTFEDSGHSCHGAPATSNTCKAPTMSTVNELFDSFTSLQQDLEEHSERKILVGGLGEKLHTFEDSGHSCHGAPATSNTCKAPTMSTVNELLDSFTSLQQDLEEHSERKILVGGLGEKLHTFEDSGHSCHGAPATSNTCKAPTMSTVHELLDSFTSLQQDLEEHSERKILVGGLVEKLHTFEDSGHSCHGAPATSNTCKAPTMGTVNDLFDSFTSLQQDLEELAARGLITGSEDVLKVVESLYAEVSMYQFRLFQIGEKLEGQLMANPPTTCRASMLTGIEDLFKLTYSIPKQEFRLKLLASLFDHF